MAGFVNEEHKAAWQPVHFRYEAEIKSLANERQEATRPFTKQRDAELEAEHERHQAANLEIHARHRAATKPIEEPFEARFEALRIARDAELKAIDNAFNP